MKVFHLIDSLGAGGKERQLVELLKGVHRNPGITNELVLLNNRIHYCDIMKLGIPIHYLNTREKGFFSKISFLLKTCRTSKPDIIQTWGHKPTRYALFIAKLLKIKVINYSIQYAKSIKKFSKLWWYGKLTFPLSDMVVANSRSGLEVHNLKESTKHRIVYNGFDFSRITTKSSEPLKKKLNLSSKYVVGMVASFSEGKDYQTLIHAGQKLLKERIDLTFLFVGDGPKRYEMEKLVRNEFMKHFVFLGTRTDVEEIVKLMDVGILLARMNHAEGISNTIMEYMALGKSVIATSVGGNKELIIDGETGFLIPHHDEDLLIAKLNFLLKYSEIREEMGKKGMERIMKLFNIENMVSSFIQIYYDLIPNPKDMIA